MYTIKSVNIYTTDKNFKVFYTLTNGDSISDEIEFIREIKMPKEKIKLKGERENLDKSENK